MFEAERRGLCWFACSVANADINNRTLFAYIMLHRVAYYFGSLPDPNPTSSPVTNNTMTAFHPFPRLPQEIRDLIWEEAAKFRTEEPGVHFFTIFNSRIEKESPPSHSTSSRDPADHVSPRRGVKTEKDFRGQRGMRPCIWIVDFGRHAVIRGLRS